VLSLSGECAFEELDSQPARPLFFAWDCECHGVLLNRGNLPAMLLVTQPAMSFLTWVAEQCYSAIS
jgi:hypothetical protein